MLMFWELLKVHLNNFFQTRLGILVRYCLGFSFRTCTVFEEVWRFQDGLA